MEPITKTQTSWWKTEVDYEPGFKFWFALMWQNWYIQIVLINIALLIAMAVDLEGPTLWFCLVPVMAIAATTILGFIKFPHDLRDQYYRQS